MRFFLTSFEDAREWCRGRNWFVRLPFLLYFIYVLVRHLQDPDYTSVLGGINLGIHELGHFIFAFFGETLHVAGGTIFQLFVPIFGIGTFLRQRDYFGIAFAIGWLSTNLFEVATYAADASSMELPLIAPFAGGEEVIHDWNFLLSAMNILQYDQTVGWIFKVLGIISMLVCFLLGGWVLWQMAWQKSSPER